MTPATRSTARGAEQLEHRLHPVSAFVVVPLFALANAGVDLGGGVLGDALSSRLTWAVVVGWSSASASASAARRLLGAARGLGALPDGMARAQVLGVGRARRASASRSRCSSPSSPSTTRRRSRPPRSASSPRRSSPPCSAPRRSPGRAARRADLASEDFSRPCRFRPPRSSHRRPSATRRTHMKYMLLIHQGTTPTPARPRGLGHALRRTSRTRVYAAYQAINQTPGVTPGVAAWTRPRRRRPCASQDGRTLTTDGPFVEIKEAIGGYFFFEADDLDAAIELAAQDPGGAHGRRDRGPPDRGVVAILEQVFRDQWGRVLAALIGFLGDFDLAEEAAQEAFAIAAERWPRDGVPGEPGRLARHDRAQPRDRPHPPRPHARREDAAARRARGGGGRRWTDDDVPRRAARADLHLLPPGARRPRRRSR